MELSTRITAPSLEIDLSANIAIKFIIESFLMKIS